MRIITLIWDTANNRLLTPGSFAALRSENEWPFIYYTEQVLVRLTFVSKEGDLFVATALPSDASAYSAVLDADYDYGTSPLLVVSSDQFNLQGDWEEDGYATTADPALGQLSLRMSADTASFRTRLGTDARSTSTRLEIICQTNTQAVSSVFTIPFIARNLMQEPGTVVPTTDPGNRYVVGEDGIRRIAYLFPDGTWRVLLPQIVDETPTHTWLTVED